MRSRAPPVATNSNGAESCPHRHPAALRNPAANHNTSATRSAPAIRSGRPRRTPRERPRPAYALEARRQPTGDSFQVRPETLHAVSESLSLGQGLEAPQRVVLDLPDALSCHTKGAANLFERPRLVAGEAKPQLDHLALALR